MKRYRIALILMVTLYLTSCTWSQDTGTLSIGPRFHEETSFGEGGPKGHDYSWGISVPLYKKYDGAAKIKLPAPSHGGMSVEEAIRKRKSVRSFSNRSISLAELSQLLLSADGLTQARGSVARRAAPSAGALYPIELYVIASDVESLSNGLFHFQVSDSSLELIAEGDFNDAVHEAANSQSCVGASPVTVILTARFDRVTRKYADRGYRYVYIEAGSVCENIYLQATSLGLGTVAVGAFNDDAVNDLVGIDGRHEAVLLIMPIGFPENP